MKIKDGELLLSEIVSDYDSIVIGGKKYPLCDCSMFNTVNKVKEIRELDIYATLEDE